MSNFICASTTRKSATRRILCECRLRCSSIGLSWSAGPTKGGGVSETPPTQQNRNNISKCWLITKTAKISTQGREPVSPDLLVLDFNGAPEKQVQLRWLLIQSSPHPPTKEKQKKHLQIINHDNNYKNIIEVTTHGLARLFSMELDSESPSPLPPALQLNKETTAFEIEVHGSIDMYENIRWTTYIAHRKINIEFQIDANNGQTKRQTWYLRAYHQIHSPA